MQNEPLMINKGSIYAYRLFDIGEEIELNHALKILQQKGSLTPYQIEKRTRSLILSEKPLTLTLPEFSYKLGSEEFQINLMAKLWSFGAVSMRAKVNFESKNFAELALIGERLERDQDFHQLVFNQCISITKDLGVSLLEPKVWNDYEDYLIYSIEECSCSPQELTHYLHDDDITAMILTEKPMKFADEITQNITSNLIRYSVDDLALVHWNGALIYDPEDAEQVADTLEFALTQLLELRFYDHKLEQQLGKLHQQLTQKPHSLIFNPYGKFAENASIEYMEITELVDRVSNSFKVVGDYYFASLFQNALEQFRIKDWRHTVDHKLASLAEISRLFKGEVHENRTLILEITIVVLIAIEVVPIVYNLFSSFLFD